MLASKYSTPLEYAMAKPDMCHFLLQNGADVDHFAAHPGLPLGFSGIALDHFLIDTPYFGNADDTLACKRLLLQAGCDPTVHPVDPTGHPDRPSPSAVRQMVSVHVAASIPQSLNRAQLTAHPRAR